MSRVFIAGHKGMVGSAISRYLKENQSVELVTRSREALDLRDCAKVRQFLNDERINEIYLAAATVGGIVANKTRPVDFILQNLQIQTSVIEAAHSADIQNLLFLGSSCIYPRDAQQPIPESALLTGPLEKSNEPYAVAKIAGIKLCESYRRQFGRDYRSIMPTNLYGPNDNFDPVTSHAIAGLLRKAHEVKISDGNEMEVWGSGTPRREFLHVDDLASACVFVMGLSERDYWSAVDSQLSHINVGTGQDFSIAAIARLCLKVAGCDAQLQFNSSMPDGTPRKLLDISKIRNLGWKATIELEDGLRDTYHWMVNHWTEVTAD